MNEEELDLGAVEAFLRAQPRRGFRPTNLTELWWLCRHPEVEWEGQDTTPPAHLTSPAAVADFWRAIGHTPSSEDWGAWRRQHGWHGRAPE